MTFTTELATALVVLFSAVTAFTIVSAVRAEKRAEYARSRAAHPAGRGRVQ